MDNQVLAVIPARHGSKGIPRKNLRNLGGKPLVAYPILTSSESEFVDKAVLTTDSEEIAEIGYEYGVDEVINRPDRLATDDVPLAPVIQHALETVDGEFEYVVSFQPTVPLVSVSSVNQGIKTATKDSEDSVIFVRDSTHLYWKSQDGKFEPVSADRKNRQQLDSIYEEIGLFVSHRKLIEAGSRISSDPAFEIVSQREGVDIDTYADWLIAENHLNRGQAVYRVTGNSQTGTGHIHRGLTIADQFFEHDILFVVNPNDDIAIRLLDENNFDYRIIDSEPEFVELLDTVSADVVVNDILDTTEEYVKTIKQTGARVVNIEDLGQGRWSADTVINSLYEHSNPPENHYYGFKYFCLRGEFRHAQPSMDISTVDRIMISFGGVDENNLTVRTLQALSSLDSCPHLDVILGPGYDQHRSIEQFIDEHPDISIEVNQEVTSMANHMQRADLLITSNGRTVYEAASLNLPMISIAQNEREQAHPYAHVSSGVLSLGHERYVSEENIVQAVSDYIDDEQTRKSMREALQKHDIRNGLTRVTNIITENISYD